jgi:hypothetical protein
VSSAAGLKEIDGVGEARIEKYGAAFLGLLKDSAIGRLNGAGGQTYETQSA